MTSPLISFVSPCCNEEAWLPRLLESINGCGGDLGLFEFIVVDNNSTDGTVPAAWELAGRLDFSLRIVHEFRQGVSYARNAGARAARGRTLVFLDADNVVTPGFISEIVCLDADPSFLGGTIRTLADSDSPVGKSVFWLLEWIKMSSPRPFGKSIARSEAFEAVQGFDVNIRLGENVDFAARLKSLARRRRASFVHIRQPIYCSLRRFEKTGYLRTLVPWLVAYLGAKRLPYARVDTL